jgi:CDP-paratose 2-epimerase
MSICLVTGAGGLVGSESVRFFAKKGMDPIGIDNDMRGSFFGKEASTHWNVQKLKEQIPQYTHYNEDIRNRSRMEKIFSHYSRAISIVIHTAAQPSHDWAASEPFTDFTINAGGTMTLLELTRKYCPEAVFIFTSTNKVYGDSPNLLPFTEFASRYEIESDHPYFKHGIDENMSIDQSKHSLFGVSKLAADLMVQEYGRYFGLKTGVFRCGCLSGGSHSGTELHGFLSYLMQCVIMGGKYTVFGHKGKQVRDNIHSYDLVQMFWYFYQNPRPAAVYNAGGGRYSNCSVLEAIEMCQEIADRQLKYRIHSTPRNGDHQWWISDVRKFCKHYPEWHYTYDLRQILDEIFAVLKDRKAKAENLHRGIAAP